MYAKGDLLFDWDEANITHIAKHNVTPEEAEQALLNDPADVERQTRWGEERLLQIGSTDAMRLLGLVTTWRDDRTRVITAYPATPAQREFYLRLKRRGQ
jgi:uncharacterized DUF497 family protein